MRLSRLFLWGLPATLLVSAAAFVAALMSPMGGLAWGVVGSGMFALMFLAIAIPCSVARERGRHPTLMLMLSGIAAAALATAGHLLTQFADLDDEQMWRVLIWPQMWGVVIACVGCLALPRPRSGWWVWTRRGTIIFVCVLALDVCVLATWNYELGRSGFDETLGRMALAIALVAGGFGLVPLLGVWLPVLAVTAPIVIDPRPFRLRCPRCRAEQEALLGEHHCRQCGLRVEVDVA